MDAGSLERRVALFTGVGLVVAVVYLVVRNEPIRDPNLVVFFRTVLSLAVGVLGGTIPGFFGFDYSKGGLVLRASGAMALAVMAFVWTPKVQSLGLAAAELELDRLQVVDLRTKLGPDASEAERQAALACATVPVSIRSEKEPALRATISNSVLRFKGAGNQVLTFSWRYFVTMHEERHGVWLGIDEDAHAFTIEPGATVFHEILHEPAKRPTWSDVLKLFAPGGPSRFDVELSVTADGSTLKQTCKIDANYWRDQVQAFEKQNNASPSRITMKCLDGVDPSN